MPLTPVRHLRRTLERIARRQPDLPPPQVLVRAPGFEFAFGDQQPFHSASVGKLMTATLVAILVERGDLDFDTPIGVPLPSTELAGLPAVPGVDVATDVTIDHLLNHTSGLPDFFEPPRGYTTACSITTVAAQRDRVWTPSDLLEEVRRLPPMGRPGERFHYSDTGYVLLGRVAEEVAGQPLATLLREHILGPGGMERSSTPYDPVEAPADLGDLDVAPFWIEGHELSRARSVSVDWAGGGIVTVPEDLVRFQQALHGGRLIADRTLAHLTQPQHRMRRGIHYGAGAMTLRFGEFAPPFLRGLPEPVGHLGILGTHLFHYGREDAHVVLNFHSTRRMRQSFATHVQIARILARPR